MQEPQPVPQPPSERSPRRRRRAVGPPGAQPSREPDLRLDEPSVAASPDDDERLRREVPPHHGD